MRILGCNAKCEKTTAQRQRRRAAVMTALALGCGWFAGPVRAQAESGSQTVRSAQTGSLLSGNETILAALAPSFNVPPGQLGNARDRILQPRLHARGSALRVATTIATRPVAIEKVNAEGSDMPAAAIVKNVTLWDELSPPSSVPGRSDNASVPPTGTSTTTNH